MAGFSPVLVSPFYPISSIKGEQNRTRTGPPGSQGNAVNFGGNIQVACDDRPDAKTSSAVQPIARGGDLAVVVNPFRAFVERFLNPREVAPPRRLEQVLWRQILRRPK